MKNIKFILVFAVVITMLSTMAFAANEGLNMASEISYSDTITFDITMAETINFVGEGYLGFRFYYDANAWTVTVDSEILDEMVSRSGYYDCLAEPEDSAINKGDVILSVTATVKDEAAAKNSTFDIKKIEIWDDDADYVYESGTYATMTVKEAAAPEPEKPESVATTYKLGNTTYTDVPNAQVTKTLTSGTISGKVIANYWKDGVKVLTPAEIPFENITIGKFTGAGEVTFDVAIMGVPTNVIITAIDVALN